MYLNFRVIIIFILFIAQQGWSQEKIDKKGIISDHPIVFEVAYTKPIFYGDNFINEGYEISDTADFGVALPFVYGTTFHLDLNVTSAEVTRPELIGNIRSANFTRVSFGFGYPVQVINKLSLLPSLHLGYIKIGQNIENRKFRDDGVFVQAELAVNYSVSGWLDISVGAKNHFDFLRIDAPAQTQSFFDNAQSIYPFIGIRLKSPSS